MTLLEAARQALPGLVWHFDGFDMVWAYPKSGVGRMGINGRHPHYHAYLRDKTAHHSSREAAAQWLRAQVESRRAALDAALGDSQWARVAELEKAVAQWVGMRGVAAARADAAEAKLKALAGLVAKWDDGSHCCEWNENDGFLPCCFCDDAESARAEARRLLGGEATGSRASNQDRQGVPKLRQRRSVFGRRHSV